MNSKYKLMLALQIVFLSLISLPLYGQTGSKLASLSGTIKDPLGSAIPNATVSLKNDISQQEVSAASDSSGHYEVKNLSPGDYAVSAAAQGFETKLAQVSLAAGDKKTLDVILVGTASNNAAPTLSDLGFPSSEIQGSSQRQELLDKRSHMLQIHQKLGMITAAAMVATLIASGGAKEHRGTTGSSSGRNLHAALGATTGALYLATAYYAIRAPKVPGIEIKGPIRLHKALAYIHGPGMILTTVLGVMAYNQLSNGERVHGIAKAHSAAAIITAAAFGGAILSVSVHF